MKKLISLFAGVVIATVAFSQDTIPTPQGNNPTLSDSMQKSNQWNKDSAGVNRNEKWPDTSMNSNRGTQDSSMSSTTRSDSNSTTNSTLNNNQATTNATTVTTATDATTSAATSADSSLTSTSKKETADKMTTDTTSSATTATADKEGVDSGGEPKVAVTDRVIMKDDKMMVIKNGDSTFLEENVTLQSGAIVSKDGTVKYKNGTNATLKNGQYITINTEPKKGTKSEKATKSTKTTKTTTKTKKTNTK